MPVYEEKETVNGQKRWFVRTYVTDEFGNSKQVTRHNKNWIGRDGKKEAEREKIRIKSKTYTQFENIKLNELFELYYKSIVNNQKKSSLRKRKR